MASPLAPTLLPALAGALILLAGCASGEPCPRPLQECGGSCVDVGSNVDHCGVCGNACLAGNHCAAGQCVPDTSAACAARGGGAFVTFEVCGSAVKTWAAAPAFIDQAALILAGAPPASPVLELVAGADCDDQWSFHADPATPTFTATPEAACDACPTTVQANLTYWLTTVRRWCPSAAAVVAVDRRP